MNTRTANALVADPRVCNARELLARSKAAVPGEAEPARWWGRVEQALESVLAAIDERGAAMDADQPPGWYAPPGE